MIVSEAMHEILNGQEIHVTLTINGRKKELHVKADQNLAYGVAAVAIQKAMAGDVKAIREVVDRVQGRPPQSIRLTPDSGPETDLPDEVLAKAMDEYERHHSGDGGTGES